MPLDLRKYNDATKQFEYVLEKSWTKQREEAKAATNQCENASPDAQAPDTCTSHPSRRPWFVILFILPGVVIVQSGLTYFILLHAAPEPKRSLPGFPVILTQEIPVQPPAIKNVELPPAPSSPTPPPPPTS